MKLETLRKYALPPGPVLSLTLIGMLFLSSTLYYRAVKVQRFLEPAVAITQPRIQFFENINALIKREFGETPSRGIQFTTDSILINKALINNSAAGPEVLRRLSRIFYSLLEDPKLRQYVNLIVINSRPTLSGETEPNREQRIRAQHQSEDMLQWLFRWKPELEHQYQAYFAAVAVPVAANETDWVEFKIIGSEQIHIDVLMRLEKYIR